MSEKTEKGTKIVLALDGLEIGEAVDLCGAVGDIIWGVKVHDMYDHIGDDAVVQLKMAGAARVWVDYKLHDIPGTGSKRALALGGADKETESSADIMTVHASGGVKMMKEVMEATPAEIFAVTVLTSLSSDDVRTIYNATPQQAVSKLAILAGMAGVSGIVCSALEVAMLNEMRCRQRIPIDASTKLVVPGTRSPGAKKGDQKRSTTPREAAHAGADVLVIGSEVTKASNPVAALERIISDISS